MCGTALDCDYPKGSNELKKQIAENGVVISEYFPGYKPFGSAFVNRNRILTGLSNAVLLLSVARKVMVLIMSITPYLKENRYL